jgi:hypothetical protein
VKLGSGGTYQLTTTSRTYSNLPSGNYVVYVRDSIGNEITYNVTVTQPTELTASIVVNTYTTCGGSADGQITISSTGGTWPKTYRLYADTDAPYTTCDGTLIGEWTSVNSNSPSVVVSNLSEYGYCLKVIDANGCMVNSGVVETTSCTGTCYEVTIQTSALTQINPNTYQTEDLWIVYTTPSNVQVNASYNQFFQTGDSQTAVTINICSLYQIAFKYGQYGDANLIYADGNITTEAMGNCNNSEWCGGNDPIAPSPTPSPTLPPSGNYFCRENNFSPCMEQLGPCTGNQIPCGEFESIQ